MSAGIRRSTLLAGIVLACLISQANGEDNRSRYDYQAIADSAGWGWLNMISTLGAFVIAAGFAVFVWDLLRPKGGQGQVPRNPWDAGTLEWATPSPPPPQRMA